MPAVATAETEKFVVAPRDSTAAYESALNVQFVPPSENLPATLPAAVTLIVAAPSPTAPSNEPTAHDGSADTTNLMSKSDVHPYLFLNVIVAKYEPGFVGTPEIAPPDNLSPVGSPFTDMDDTSDFSTPTFPGVAESTISCLTPANISIVSPETTSRDEAPFGFAEHTTVNPGSSTTIVIVFEAVPASLLAETFTAYVPTFVALPEIAPLEYVRPGGNPLTLPLPSKVTGHDTGTFNAHRYVSSLHIVGFPTTVNVTILTLFFSSVSLHEFSLSSTAVSV